MKNLLILVASALLLAACASRPSMPPGTGQGPERCTEALQRTSGICGQP